MKFPFQNKNFLTGFTPLKKNFLTGFTLIELLAVIAIIGLLTSIIAVSVNQIRAKTRDIKRKDDLIQIRLTLEIYYDRYGYFPNLGVYITNTDALSNLFRAEEIINNLPSDPRYAGGGDSRDYQYFGVNGHYLLRAALETNNEPKTHNYPDGVSCATIGLPTASWWGDAVYDGYNPITCGRTLQLGTNYY